MPPYPSTLAEDGLTNTINPGPAYLLLLQELQHGKPFATSHPTERAAESARELAEIPAIEVELEKLHRRDLAALPTSCTDADLPGSCRCPSDQRDASKAHPKTLWPPSFGIVLCPPSGAAELQHLPTTRCLALAGDVRHGEPPDPILCFHSFHKD